MQSITEDSACFEEKLTDNEVIKGALICLILAYTAEFFYGQWR